MKFTHSKYNPSNCKPQVIIICVIFFFSALRNGIVVTRLTVSENFNCWVGRGSDHSGGPGAVHFKAMLLHTCDM